MRRLLVTILLGGLLVAGIFGGLAIYGLQRMGAFDPPKTVR